MSDHSASRHADALAAEAPHLLSDAAPQLVTRFASGAVHGAIGCLQEAEKELARATPNATWYAARHLEDAISEARRALRLVNQLPQSL